MSLEVQDLNRSFFQGDAEIKVLRNLSFSVKRGETVAILGESGSGKSTLLSLLAGLDRPDHGEIFVQSTRYSSLDENSMNEFRAKNIGIVFQQFHLMTNLTALENISLPLEIRGQKHATEKAEHWLSQVGLSKRADHFPHQLSGGEKQRVAIARALIIEPNLLLADEPSGSLDVKTGEQVMNLLFDLAKNTNMTTVLVTHSSDLAARCNRILGLESGQLREAR